MLPPLSRQESRMRTLIKRTGAAATIGLIVLVVTLLEAAPLLYASESVERLSRWHGGPIVQVMILMVFALPITCFWVWLGYPLLVRWAATAQQRFYASLFVIPLTVAVGYEAMVLRGAFFAPLPSTPSGRCWGAILVEDLMIIVLLLLPFVIAAGRFRAIAMGGARNALR